LPSTSHKNFRRVRMDYFVGIGLNFLDREGLANLFCHVTTIT